MQYPMQQKPLDLLFYLTKELSSLPNRQADERT